MSFHPPYEDIFRRSLYGHDYQGCETLVQSIERNALRKLTMETSLVNNLSRCHQQDQCPLYGKLPKEIRDEIFELATAQYEDLDRPYKTNCWYYRPGYRGPRRTSTGLLRTCRRVWLEANALPMRQYTKTFWYESHRGPPNQKSYDFADNWTTLNKNNFQNLHFFTQKHMADRMFTRPDAAAAIMDELRPKVIRVTWRHTDWNRWEDPLPLHLDDAWLERALSYPWLQGVDRFELELETLSRKKDQLDAIVDRISKFEGSPMPSRVGLTKLKIVDKPHVWQWTGPPNINDHVDDAHEGMDELDYHVVVLTWKAIPIPAGENGGSHADATRMGYMDQLRNRGVRRGVPPPRMITHTVRLHLLRDGWHRRQFPFANYMVRKDDIDNAQSMEEHRRFQFLKMFADIEARKMEEEWKAKDSLLKFEG